MSRRQLPRPIERKTVDAKALGCQCSVCPLGIAGQKPITPTKGNGRLLIVSGRPSAIDDRHGEIRTTKTQKLLDNVLTASGAREYVQTPAILCRPHDGATENEIKEAVQCCRPHIERAIEQVRSERSPGEPVWVLTTAQEAFNAVTGKLGSEDSWRGSPVESDLPGVKVIPTFDPWNIATAKGSRYAAVFTTHVDRYVKLSTGQLPPFEWPEIVVDYGSQDLEVLERLAEYAERGGEVSLDIETRGLGLDSEISCIGFASDRLSCCIQLPTESWRAALIQRIVNAGVMVGQNLAAFDRRVLQRKGYALTDKWEDTMLAASILDPQLDKNLGFLVNAEFHAEAHKAEFKADKETGVMTGTWDSTDPEIERERREYCLKDSYTTLLLWQVQKQRLKEYGQQFYEELKELALIAIEMQDTGICWDFKAAKELEDKYTAKLKKAEEHLQKGADALGWRRPRVNDKGKDITRKAPLNVGSSQQLAELFYREMGLAPTIWTDKGKPSTNDDALMDIIAHADNPTAVAFAKKVTDYRDAEKALGTYVLGMAPGAQRGTKKKRGIDNDYPLNHRVHGEWRSNTAPSRRWSCTQRGFQTLNAEMRRLLTVEEGNLAIEADLPSAEVRTVMLFAGQDDIIDLLNDGGDLYSTAATKIFGKPVSKKENKHLRQLGKLTILASHYGAAGDTVFFQIWKDLVDPGDPESKTIIETFPDLTPKKITAIQNLYFRDTAPRVKQWMLDEVKACNERGYYLSPISGVRVACYGPADLNFATNLPNQETVAMYMNAALRRIHKQLKPQDKLLTYIHDSLTLETSEKDIDRLRDLLLKEMEGEIEYRGRRVLMKPVEYKVGKNLAEVK